MHKLISWTKRRSIIAIWIIVHFKLFDKGTFPVITEITADNLKGKLIASTHFKISSESAKIYSFLEPCNESLLLIKTKKSGSSQFNKTSTWITLMAISGIGIKVICNKERNQRVWPIMRLYLYTDKIDVSCVRT